MRLRGAHHCYCNGSAFYMRDGEPVEARILRYALRRAWLSLAEKH
jgi:hypothetical protein